MWYGLGMSDQSKREPFFGPLPNILIFVAFILSGLLIRAWAHFDHQRVIARTLQAHSAGHSESGRSHPELHMRP